MFVKRRKNRHRKALNPHDTINKIKAVKIVLVRTWKTNGFLSLRTLESEFIQNDSMNLCLW